MLNLYRCCCCSENLKNNLCLSHFTHLQWFVFVKIWHFLFSHLKCRTKGVKLIRLLDPINEEGEVAEEEEEEEIEEVEDDGKNKKKKKSQRHIIIPTTAFKTLGEKYGVLLNGINSGTEVEVFLTTTKTKAVKHLIYNEKFFVAFLTYRQRTDEILKKWSMNLYVESFLVIMSNYETILASLESFAKINPATRKRSLAGESVPSVGGNKKPRVEVKKKIACMNNQQVCYRWVLENVVSGRNMMGKELYWFQADAEKEGQVEALKTEDGSDNNPNPPKVSTVAVVVNRPDIHLLVKEAAIWILARNFRREPCKLDCGLDHGDHPQNPVKATASCSFNLWWYQPQFEADLGTALTKIDNEIGLGSFFGLDMATAFIRFSSPDEMKDALIEAGDRSPNHVMTVNFNRLFEDIFQ